MVDVYAAVWEKVAPSPASLDVVRALRRNGYGVHVATNQGRHRVPHRVSFSQALEQRTHRT